MLQPKSFITVALLCLCCATTANAAELPRPQDILYPGTLTLSVDLTDLDRRLFMVRVRAGETGSVDPPLSAMAARHPWTQWPSQPAYGPDDHGARPAFAVAPRSGQHVRVPYRCAS